MSSATFLDGPARGWFRFEPPASTKFTKKQPACLSDERASAEARLKSMPGASDPSLVVSIDDLTRGGDVVRRSVIVLLDLDDASFGFLAQLRRSLASLSEDVAYRSIVDRALQGVLADEHAASDDFFRLGATWARRLLVADQATFDRVCVARRDFAIAARAHDLAGLKYVIDAAAEFLAERDPSAPAKLVELDD